MKAEIQTEKWSRLNMRTVYIADDGKQFEDEYECEHHEFELKHPHLQTIEAYNKDGEKITGLLDEDAYDNCERIILHSEEELSDLQYGADYFGFYSYCDIDEVGEWIFDHETEHFSKNEKSTFIKGLSDKYIEILKECRSIKYQEHADNTLLKLLSDLGYADVVKAYREVPKWYS